MDCLFCKIIAGEIPCTPLYEDEDCLAFPDIAPQAPTHFLIIPKAHVDSLGPGQGELVGKIFDKIPQIAQSLGLTDYRVVTNRGEGAGQTVMHLHFHVLGGRELSWPPG